MGDLDKLPQLRQRAREIWVDNVPGPEVDETALSLRIAEREAELLASNNALYMPNGAPECYAQLYDPTAEEDFNGTLLRPCIVCAYGRRCGSVMRARFGRAPGDPMPPPDGADPMPERTSAPPRLSSSKPSTSSGTKPRGPKPLPPLATKPKDEVTGLTLGSKINTTVRLLLEGVHTKDEIIQKVTAEHGGAPQSNKNTVNTAIWDVRHNLQPQLGNVISQDAEGKLSLVIPVKAGA